LRELLGELKLITATFPDIHEVVEDDDLPIGFIIRRDAARVGGRAPNERAQASPSKPTPTLKRRRSRVKT
jgi:hypothetical protein